MITARVLLLLIWTVAIVAVAVPAARRNVLVKEEFRPPLGWVIHDAAPKEHSIRLRIGLVQSNFAELERHLYEVSDPQHARYGEHLSKEDVEALVAPHADSVELVHEWLASHGFGSEELAYSSAQDWILLDVTVAQAEEMLDTQYHIWKHSESGDVLVRTTRYSLPAHLHDHIDVIQPTTMFARITKHMRPVEPDMPTIELQSANSELSELAATDPSCNTTITITCLNELYNVNGYVPQAADKGNKIAATGYLGQHANMADFDSFLAAQVPNVQNFSFDVILLNNGTNPQTDAGGEANLDTQFAFGLAAPTPATFFSTGGSPPFNPDAHTPNNTNEPYQQWLDFVLAQKDSDIPQTITTSYGDDEQTVPPAFAQRVCAGFAQLGARGVSLMFSSGDDGVGDGDANPATQKCQTNDGKNTTRFIPEFPASCPFVTSVGGTIHIPEVAVDFSGGGFSNLFPRPAYQDLAVGRFLDGVPLATYAGLFNRNGRGIPDVSMQSVRFATFIHGTLRGVSGTSAASPAFAGLVALANDARIAAGRPSLGFLNPLIYTIGELGAFNDITVGNNPGCGTPGFNATAKWDAVTGWGSMDFERFKNFALVL